MAARPADFNSETADWTERNRDINPSNAIIIYAWNENDEGGWLIPTPGADGRADEERINAVSECLPYSGRASQLAARLPEHGLRFSQIRPKRRTDVSFGRRRRGR